MKARIRTEIARLEQARDQFIQDGNLQIARYQAAIGALQALLSEERPAAERKAREAGAEPSTAATSGPQASQE